MIDLLYHLRVYKCKHRSFTLVYTYRKNQFLGTLARSGVHLLHAISYGEQLSRLSFFMPGANRVQPELTSMELMDFIDSLIHVYGGRIDTVDHI